MSELWNIYKDGRQIGPLTASDIRRGLREGEFDPFDLVARDGSNLRRELVEVDELFFTSQVVYGNDAAASTADMQAVTQELSRSKATASGFLPSKIGVTPKADDQLKTLEPRPASPMLGQGHLALADQGATVPSLASSPHPRPMRRQRNPKHFLLMNSVGRVLGPMSATEVQSLYFRGVLANDVVVMRPGSEAKIKLSRFISVLSGNRGSKTQMQGAHPVTGVLGLLGQNRQRMIFSTTPFGLQPMAAMALIAAFMLFLASGLLLIEHKTGKLSALADKMTHRSTTAAPLGKTGGQNTRRKTPAKTVTLPLPEANKGIPALAPTNPNPAGASPRSAAATQAAAQAAFIAADGPATLTPEPAAPAAEAKSRPKTPKNKPHVRQRAAAKSRAHARWRDAKPKSDALPRGN